MHSKALLGAMFVPSKVRVERSVMIQNRCERRF